MQTYTNKQQLGLGFRVCEADFVLLSCFMVYRVSVVEETELTYVKRHPRGHGDSWEELMGGRLEKEGGDIFRPQLRKREGSWQHCSQLQGRRKRLPGREGGAGSRAGHGSLK